jgi:glutathione S-transferase
MSESNVKLCTDFMNALAAHDFAKAENALAEDFLFAGPVPQPIPKPAFMAMERAVHAAFDRWDYGLRVTDRTADTVSSVCRITATHARPLALPMPGMSPIKARGVAVALPEEPCAFKVKDGRIARIDVTAPAGGGIPGLLAQIALAPTPGGNAPFVLYGHPVSGTTYKAALALSIAEQRFELRHVELFMGVHKQPAFFEKSRFGQVPALEHEGRVVVQSNVILHYLADKLGMLGGRTEDEKLRAHEWLAWEADQLLPGTALAWSVKTFKGTMFPDEPALFDFLVARGRGALATLEAQLARTPYLAGESLTIADLSCIAYVDRWEEVGLQKAEHPHVEAWIARVKSTRGFVERAALWT